MAQEMNAGRTQLVVKDWERILTMYGADVIRVNLDGDIELLIGSVWCPITGCSKVADGSGRVMLVPQGTMIKDVVS